MRLDVARRGPVLPPTVPMANLALLLVLVLAVVAVHGSAKGIGLRLSDPAVERLPAAEATGAVWIRIAADGGIRLDGAPADSISLSALLREKLRGAPAATVVVYADPDATYQSVVSVYDAVIGAASPGPAPRIALPTPSQVEEWARAAGRNPFEAAP